MPTYDYVCGACGHALEIFHSMSEAPKKKCPACGKAKLERQIGAGAGFLFKGQGFYKTDYRSDSYKAGEKAENTEKAPAAGGEAAKPAAGEKATSETPAQSKNGEPKTAPEKPAAKSETESKPKKGE